MKKLALLTAFCLSILTIQVTSLASEIVEDENETCVLMPKPGEGFVGTFGNGDLAQYKQAETLASVFESDLVKNILAGKTLVSIAKIGNAPVFYFRLEFVSYQKYIKEDKVYSNECISAKYVQRSKIVGSDKYICVNQKPEISLVNMSNCYETDTIIKPPVVKPMANIL